MIEIHVDSVAFDDFEAIDKCPEAVRRRLVDWLDVEWLWLAEALAGLIVK